MRALLGRAARIHPLTSLAWGLGLRLACAFVPAREPRDDAVHYVTAARELASGVGYLLRGHPSAYWPVGYPLFLSLVFRATGSSLIAVRVIQAILSSGMIYLAYSIGRRLYGREEPARLGALLLAFIPSQITYPASMLSEVLYASLTLAGFALFLRSLRWPWAVASGAGFGLAELVRPVAFLLPALGALWGDRGAWLHRLRAGMIAFGVMLCVLSPWVLRNMRVLHSPIWVSTNGGINLWMGNHPGATGSYEFTPEMAAASRRIGNEVAFDAYARARAVAFVREHPTEALSLLWRKVVLLWSPDHNGVDGVFPRLRSWQRKLSVALSDVAYFGVWLLLIAGLAARRRPAGLPIVMLLYYTAIYAATVAMPRYQFPAIPWLAMAAAAIAMPAGSSRAVRLAISSSLGRPEGRGGAVAPPIPR